MTLTTHREINDLELRDKKYNRGCGDGLYLRVEPLKNGHSKYFWGGIKNKSVWIGRYGTGPSEYSLKDAKEEWFKIKRWCLDHNEHPKNYKKRDYVAKTHTLRNAIDDFLQEISKSVKETTHKEYCYKLNTTVLNYIDEETPLKELEWDQNGRIKINNVLDKIADNKKFELRERCRKLLKQTFEHAIDLGYMGRGQNPAVKGLRRQIGHKIIHHKSISWDEIPKLLLAINQNKCNADYNTVLCTKFMLLTGLRAGAATRIQQKWCCKYLTDDPYEEDEAVFKRLENEGKFVIAIPGDTSGLKRRKGTSDHIPHYVPITKPIIQLIRKANQLNGTNEYLFPAYRTKKYPHLNPEAPNKFLGNVGYKNTLVAHGVRSIFMTASREKLKFPHRIIDLQLGHIPGHKVDAAYDRSQMLEERLDLLEQYNALLVEAGLEI